MTEFRRPLGFEEALRPPIDVRRARITQPVLRPSGRAGDAAAYAQLARIIRRAPEVMVKVTGSTRDGDHLMRHLSEVDMHLLMNHALPGVNSGYITRSKLMRDHLRTQQERLSAFFIGAAVKRGRPSSDELSRWLNSTSRTLLDDLMAEDPDAVRLKAGPRAAIRKLEVQAARLAVHALPSVLIDAPSRRSRISTTRL